MAKQTAPEIAEETDKGIQIQGVVTDSLPNANFKIQGEQGHEILAHISGKMRLHRIKILPGDRVLVEVSPYDLCRGRIIFRYK